MEDHPSSAGHPQPGPRDSAPDQPLEPAAADVAADVAPDVAPDERAKPADATPATAWQPQSILGGWAAFGLATLSLVLCPIGFAGIDVWPIAFFAWVPLILALRGQTPKRAVALGWWAGFGMTAIGFHWLVEMLEVFSGFPLPLCIVFAAVVCVQKGGRIALMALLYARMSRRGWHHGLSFLAAFAVSELVYPLLFPWYYGASVHRVPLLMQTADLGGPIAVSMVILAVNVALAELAIIVAFKQKPDRRMLVGGLAVLALAVGYGFLRMRSVDARVATGTTIKVGMVQGNQGLKDRGRAVAVHVERTKELLEQGVDLVVWSEAAIPRGYEVTRYEKEIKRVTGTLKVPTVVGAVLYERIPDAGPKGRRARYFNTALIADAAGDIKGRYDKQFLLMFGEYLPLGDTFPILYKWSPNSGAFSPGTSFQPLPFGEQRLATMICYEDIIPSFVNKLVAAGKPNLLVNMTNDAWFGDTIEPWQHLALAKFRSVEHRLFLVRVTNTGVTAIVDPVGRVQVHGGTFAEEALVGQVTFLGGSTVYSTLGDGPWWIVTLLVALASVVHRQRVIKAIFSSRPSAPS